MSKFCIAIDGSDEGKSMYMFSDDLFWGCRYYATKAQEATKPFEIVASNISCVFCAGSFLEAKINEFIALTASSKDKNIQPSRKFWQVLLEFQKDMKLKEKWNLMASIKSGRRWNEAVEPFQSYDLLIALRNELVHYKGKFSEDEKPPIKKLKALTQRFKGLRDIKMQALGISCWVHQLLTAPELGCWIADTIEDLDINFEVYLFNQKLTKEQRRAKKLGRMCSTPF